MRIHLNAWARLVSLWDAPSPSAEQWIARANEKEENGRAISEWSSNMRLLISLPIAGLLVVACTSNLPSNGGNPAGSGGAGGSAGTGGQSAGTGTGGQSTTEPPLDEGSNTHLDGGRPSDDSAPSPDLSTGNPPFVPTAPGTKPPAGHSAFFGMNPTPGTPAAMGNTTIFDDTCGVVWNPTTQELLFSVCQNNDIRKWKLGDPTDQGASFPIVRPISMDAQGQPIQDNMSGIELGPDGSLWVCEDAVTPERVTRSTGGYNNPMTVIDHWPGSAARPAGNLNKPRYLSARWDGNIYFIESAGGPSGYYQDSPKGLFRIDPAGNLTLIKQHATGDTADYGPFGIALSPDHNSLYISTMDRQAHSRVVRFDLANDGSVANPAGTIVFTDTNGPVAAADGLCIDQAENFYVCSGGDGIVVYDHTGAALTKIKIPGAVDCSFGGANMRTLFAAAGSGEAVYNLWQVPMAVPGLP